MLNLLSRRAVRCAFGSMPSVRVVGSPFVAHATRYGASVTHIEFGRGHHAFTLLSFLINLIWCAAQRPVLAVGGQPVRGDAVVLHDGLHAPGAGRAREAQRALRV